MDEIKDQLLKLAPSVNSLKEIGIHKKLAKFGDTVTNLTYSLAKTIVSHQLDQQKVSRTILSSALKEAKMKIYAKKRSNAHDMANTAEAFIGYMYCKEKWSVEYMASLIIPVLSQYNLDDVNEELIGAIKSFRKLLEKIKEFLILKLES